MIYVYGTTPIEAIDIQYAQDTAACIHNRGYIVFSHEYVQRRIHYIIIHAPHGEGRSLYQVRVVYGTDICTKYMTYAQYDAVYRVVYCLFLRAHRVHYCVEYYKLVDVYVNVYMYLVTVNVYIAYTKRLLQGKR